MEISKIKEFLYIQYDDAKKELKKFVDRILYSN